MSTFKSTLTTRTMEIHPDVLQILLHTPDKETVGVRLNATDAPAIALAVLEAGGFAQGPFPDRDAEEATYFLQRHVRESEAKAAAAAEEAARGKRRDELALKFTGQSIANFDEGWAIDLIDHIIDTENELAKERSK